MKCTISDWGCIYHACMSDDCQKKEVLKHDKTLGTGKCENVTPDQQLADKIINELEEAGFTPDQMIEVIKMAREKYIALEEIRQKTKVKRQKYG